MLAHRVIYRHPKQRSNNLAQQGKVRTVKFFTSPHGTGGGGGKTDSG
jgi:hypothetical protein